MAHTVGFEEQRQLQRAGRHRLEIIGAIEPGGAVEIGRARVFQRHEELPVRVFRAVEHQMLEQMGKAGLADRKSTRLNSSQYCASRMPSSACNKKKKKQQPT